jgi:phage/plasmid-associated DNA primase
MANRLTDADYITQAKTNQHVKNLEKFLEDESIKAPKHCAYTNVIDQGHGRTFQIPFRNPAMKEEISFTPDFSDLNNFGSGSSVCKVRGTKTKMDKFFDLLEAARLSGAHLNFSERQYFTVAGKKSREYLAPESDYATNESVANSQNPSESLEDSGNGESSEANYSFAEYDSEEVNSGEDISEYDEIANGSEEEVIPTTVEKQTSDGDDYEVDKSGIMFDFDIFQRASHKQIMDSHLYQLAFDIAKLLSEVVEWQHAADPHSSILLMWAAFISKPEVVPVHHKVYGDCYKDGFHFLLPGVKVTKAVKRYIMKKLLEDGILQQTFRGIEFLNPFDDMLDPNSINVPVLFLGNGKRGKIPYKFHQLYRVQLRTYDNMPLVQICNEFDPVRDTRGPMKVKDPRDARKYIMVDRPPSYKYNLTYELSLHFESPNGLIKMIEYEALPELETEINAYSERRAGNLIPEQELRETASQVADLTVRNSEAAYLQQILNILAPHRVREYADWKAVVLVLARRSQEYKPLAAWFSQRWPGAWVKNAAAVIDSLFEWAKNHSPDDDEDSNRRVRDIGTLYHWARTDNPDKFYEIQSMNAFNVLRTLIMQNDGNLNDSNIAKVLYTMFKNKFIFAVNPLAKSRAAAGKWYEFVLPTDKLGRTKAQVYKYREEIYPYTLDTYISEKLPLYIKGVRDWIQEKRDAEDADEATQSYYDHVYKQIKKTSQMLGNAGKSAGIIKKCENEFLDRGFIEALDTNRHVIGVGNGVLRVFPKTELIRQYHNIAISRYTDVEYLEYDPKNPYVKELENAIRQLFAGEEDAFRFTMMYLASTLDGRPKVPLLFIWLGQGSNGKSFLLELHINTLRLVPVGGYGAKLPVEFLTHQRPSANASNPAMMMLKSARFVYFSESESGDTLRMGNIKEITSETLSSRNHHESQDNFRANCHFVFCSNNDPRVQGSDHGTWRRILIYRFKMKFVPDPDPQNPRELKQDTKWIDVVPHNEHYKRAYLSILMKYYEEYRDKFNSNLHNVLRVTPTILRETQAFRNEQDTINRFCTTQVVHVGPEYKGEPTERIAMNEVAKQYTKWYRAAVEDTNLPSGEIVKALKASCLQKWIITQHKRSCLTECIILGPNATYNPEDGESDPEDEEEFKSEEVDKAVASDDSEADDIEDPASEESLEEKDHAEVETTSKDNIVEESYEDDLTDDLNE